MRLQNFGFVVTLLFICSSLISCSGEVKKPVVVQTKTKKVLSAQNRNELYDNIDYTYGQLTIARRDHLDNIRNYYATTNTSTLTDWQSSFRVNLSILEKEGLTQEIIDRLKEIQLGEKKSSDAFQKAKSSCNSNPEIAKICSFEMAFFNKRIEQIFSKYPASELTPTPKQK